MRTRLVLLLILGVLGPDLAVAQDGPEVLSTARDVQTNLDYVWTVLAAMLVFFMQAGFALLETGLTRAKNAINIIMKNVTDASVGVFVFFAVGFGVMFGSSLNGLIGTTGFFLSGLVEQHGTWAYAFFFFQAVFAATAATIVSGAVAERTRFAAYLVFSVIVTGLIYPIFGAWAWGGLLDGGGWLEQLGFIDFAGSTVVHSIGGWAALAGTIVVGPRRDKYEEDGTPRAIAGHSLPLAALGVFILWLGWFAFNAGSTNAGTPAIAQIVVNTFLASAAGGMGALFAAWIRTGTPTPMLTLNGVLGGLVSITAGCATLVPGGAILTGGLAGMMVVYATAALDWVIDDPVGAVAVHGVCGAWGTVAARLFDVSGVQLGQLGVQVLGVATAFLWAFPVSYVAFQFADRLVGLRLPEAVEEKGLDRHEHDAEAYPDFSVPRPRGTHRAYSEGIGRSEVFEDDPGPRNPLALDQGTLLDDQFRIGRVLGIGGFGITYLAFDEVLEMGVAVKEYLPSDMAARKTGSHTVQPLSTTGAEMDEADFENGLERFLQEARTLARFERHPNIVRVRTFFQENGTAYLVMNFYRGRTLAEYLALNNGFIPEEEVLLIMQQVFDGLAVVHEADVLHRDIDPSNVYLANDGTVVLLDFGAARAAMGERTHNKSAVMKRGYAPYEQYRTEGTQGPWTDVYACAATLYRCLTGYKPPEAAGRLLDDELVPPDELVPSLSASTNAAIRKGLSVQPEARPQSVDALASLLPDPPADRTPGWVGTGSTLDVSLSATGTESELRVRTSHPCRLYVDGDATGEFDPGESYTLGVEPGTHRLRAVRTDQTSERSVTVTAEEADTEDDHVSLEALVWQDVVSTSRDEPTDTEIDFEAAGMDGDVEGGEKTVRLD